MTNSDMHRILVGLVYGWYLDGPHVGEVHKTEGATIQGVNA
jgi:hypothetical protein